MPKKSPSSKRSAAAHKAPVRSRPVKSKARNKSWLPGRKGQGGEGLSEGYGGSAGGGTGASGPEHTDDEKIEREFPSLPSRERIARVLR